ncbi:flagellar biosynthesis protein FlhB (plasmid) [Vibrio breoganii]|uniref:Flagellar biosynthetic protein FlhB n=1 Tax=Vibrio breoganii TaxID=553239 RepID=A0AAN1CU23_9VIBR|nr:flagellar biosynthesis protein FlhB [Vibrio breoganii]ANO35283.1 flagellar biosynthesis protein FlhB [Vibrio breoganii]
MADSNKTELATPEKLRKSREEGQLPRSKDLISAITFSCVAIYTMSTVERFQEVLQRLMTYCFTFERSNTSRIENFIPLNQIAIEILWLFLPMLVIGVLAAFISGIIIGGPEFRGVHVKPKAERINPLKGLKRLFSHEVLVDLFKNIVKISIVFYLLYSTLSTELGAMSNLSRGYLGNSLGYFFSVIKEHVFSLITAFIIFGMIDAPYQKFKFLKKMKMSLQDVKDEIKNSEGRPEIKQRIKQAVMQNNKNALSESVPTADVIITNPTHYSVALKYDKHKSNAPYVVAKGVDELALHIRKVARENDIEIVESPELARSIFFTTRVFQAIPMPLYLATGKILGYILELNRYKRDGLRKPLAPKNIAGDIPQEFKY